MNDWLSVNLGITFEQILLFLSVLGNLLLIRDRHTARAIQANNATIKSLETSLAAERVAVADAKTETERWQGDANKYKEDLANRTVENRSFQDKISELERLMIERPSLVAWGKTMYREAFPADPDHPVFYCAACWFEKRWVVPIDRHNNQFLACKHWEEDWHRSFRPDSILVTN